jgi:hypothetical protein
MYHHKFPHVTLALIIVKLHIPFLTPHTLHPTSLETDEYHKYHSSRKWMWNTMVKQTWKQFQFWLNSVYFYCQDIPIARILYITLTVTHINSFCCMVWNLLTCKKSHQPSLMFWYQPVIQFLFHFSIFLHFLEYFVSNIKLILITIQLPIMISCLQQMYTTSTRK